MKKSRVHLKDIDQTVIRSPFNHGKNHPVHVGFIVTVAEIEACYLEQIIVDTGQDVF